MAGCVQINPEEVLIFLHTKPGAFLYHLARKNGRNIVRNASNLLGYDGLCVERDVKGNKIVLGHYA